MAKKALNDKTLEQMFENLYYDSSTKFIFLSKLKFYFCVFLSAESDISSLEKIISLFIM